MTKHNQITELKENEIFVFGSNLAGRTGNLSRAAMKQFGAQYRIGEGLTGRCYALPTKDYRVKTLPLSEIKRNIDNFIRFAQNNTDLNFILTPVGS